MAINRSNIKLQVTRGNKMNKDKFLTEKQQTLPENLQKEIIKFKKDKSGDKLVNKMYGGQVMKKAGGGMSYQLYGEIQVTKRPLALASATGTSATTSNYFSEFCYNALFDACMVESMIFMKNYSLVPAMEQKFQGSINALRNQARRTIDRDWETKHYNKTH